MCVPDLHVCVALEGGPGSPLFPPGTGCQSSISGGDLWSPFGGGQGLRQKEIALRASGRFSSLVSRCLGQPTTS